VSKEEIIAAIKKCAEELGRCPSLGELLKQAQLSRRQIRKAFGNYAMAVRASGMEPPRGAPVKLEELFLDWADVVRKLKKLPTIFEYEGESAYSSKPLISRFKGWRGVAPMMLAYAERNGLEAEWTDVVEIIRADSGASWRVSSTAGPGFSSVEGPRGTGRILRDRPTFGPPMAQSGMLCGPENENGVLVLFGMRAWQLGFAIKKVRPGFPDIIALRKIDEQTWQEVRIEVEHESRNFLRHGHTPSGADLIVCWIHNWPECPLEVIELSKVEW
jgi:hypothetical protein